MTVPKYKELLQLNTKKIQKNVSKDLDVHFSKDHYVCKTVIILSFITKELQIKVITRDHFMARRLQSKTWTITYVLRTHCDLGKNVKNVPTF